MRKIAFVLALFASLILADPQYGGTIVFGRGGDSSTMDPAHATDGESFYGTTQVYDNLAQFKYGTTEIEPGLATSWDVSEDGLTYIFHLRQGVYFAPTAYFKKKVEFSADDVVFSFERQFKKDHPYNKIGGAFEYWAAMDMDNIIKSVEKIDKYTVKFTLKKPEAPFIANIAMDFASILCKEYADDLLKQGKADDINRLPVGTGPFIFEKWIKDDKIFYKANKDHWAGRPYIDRLILRVILNNSVRAAELKTGQIQIMDFPNPAEISSLKQDPKLQIIEQEGMNVGYMAINLTRPEYKNLKVRQALNYAINKKLIIDTIYEGLGRVADSPLPPNVWSFTEDIQKYNYNPQKAKDLLKEAGFEKGFKTKLWVLPVARSAIPDGKKVGQAIQADLAKVGIDAEIVTYDWVTYLDRTKQLEHDLCLMIWTGDNGDPDNFLNVLLSKEGANVPATNFAAWVNDEFDSLIKKAKLTSDIKERTDLYMKAQQIFARELPWVTLANSVVVTPALKNIKGFKMDPVGKRRFKEVWIEK